MGVFKELYKILFDEDVLRRIFSFEADEVNGENYIVMMFIIFNFTMYCKDVQNKDNKIGGTCMAHGKECKCTQNLAGKCVGKPRRGSEYNVQIDLRRKF